MEQVLDSGTARVRVRTLGAKALRVTHLPPDGSVSEDRPWLKYVLKPGSSESPSELRVEQRDGRVAVLTASEECVFSEARRARVERDGSVLLAFTLRKNECYYGGGEWFNSFRRSKGKVHLWSGESPAVLQSRRTYSNIPFFLSSRGYGLLLLNSHESWWELDPAKGELRVRAAGPPADYVLIYGPAFREILTTYTELTGRPPLVPIWAFGLWVTEYPQEGQDRVMWLVREHRSRKIPLDAVILDYHWEERFHNLRWRKALFSEPDRLIDSMRQAGVKLGLILTPFVNNKNVGWKKTLLNAVFHNVPVGREKDDERALSEYEEARAQGYLAHEHAGWWFGSGGMIDFSSPSASRWWNAKLRPLYDSGVAFFKNDDGEYLPGDAHSALGMSGSEYHNLYGLFYGRALYDGMAGLDERRPLIYARSVWAGSQRYPGLFLGDQKPTHHHIRATMRAGLNMSLAGFSYWTADVFGLDGKTTPETHMRYAQWALMVPLARYFWRPPAIDDTRFPWSHGPEVEDNFRRYVELRYRLLPHYYALAHEACSTGLPILRPVVLEFQQDPRVASIADQFLLGSQLMLAPVVQAGARSRAVYLPVNSEWHDFWSCKSFTGGQEISYEAPLDRLPILVRGGTVLLMGPVLQHIAGNHHFDELYVHCWPPYPARGTLYEDDGLTRSYQENGECSVTPVSVEQEGQRIHVHVGAATGSFPGQPRQRSWTLVLHRIGRVRRVRCGGRECAGWTYNDDTHDALVRVQWPTGDELSLEIEVEG